MKRYRIRYADWSAAEYVAALGCVLGGRVARGPNPERLAAHFAQLYAPSRAHPVNYAHAALAIALDLFQARRPGRTEVVVPAYICPSVVQAIEAAGLTAIPAAIGADLNMTPAGLQAALGADTLAVVAPHMFGCPCAIVDIERICREAGVFLVDDAAQVVGESAAGRLLGTYGDVGLVSFAQSKAVVTGVRGSGGVLLVNNRELDEDARAACERLPAPSGRVGALLHFLWHYQWLPVTGHSGYYLSRIAARFGLRARSHAGAARISNLDAGIALAQLARLGQLRAAKIAAAQAYQAALATIPGVAFPQYAPGRYLSRVMVSLPPQVDLETLRRDLARRGVDTRLGYLQPVRPDGPDQAAPARRLLGLPFGAHLSCSQINNICSILSAALATVLPALSSEIANNEPYKTTLQG